MDGSIHWIRDGPHRPARAERHRISRHFPVVVTERIVAVDGVGSRVTLGRSPHVSLNQSNHFSGLHFEHRGQTEDCLERCSSVAPFQLADKRPTVSTGIAQRLLRKAPSGAQRSKNTAKCPINRCSIDGTCRHAYMPADCGL
jgi:hypothetical protein